MHELCLRYCTKPVAAGDGDVDGSLSPGKMVHTFAVYAALVIRITFVTFSGIKNLANYILMF
jgi:hypothetical protein